jgi:two-component system, OmpR family, KDP operon response regulator KdpE
MGFAEPSANARRRPLRIGTVGIVSPPDWLSEFDLVSTTLEWGAGRPDLYVIAASDADHLALVAELAADGMPTLVIGDDDPTNVSRYLDAGAYDYLSNRSSDAECAAKVRAIGRLLAPASDGPTDTIRIGDVSISVGAHRVQRRGAPVYLTRNEFRVLELLLDHADQPVSHAVLTRRLWDEEPRSARHYLRAYVRQLREKLERDPEHPELIVTEWGIGYRLQRGRTDEESASA